ncbi:MAG: linear amide C-N hydrolase [Clostridia bacterium]|nr:linear amide C-N hydrolase [Clostridia bacterium]
MEKIKKLWSKLWFRIVSIVLAVIILLSTVFVITLFSVWGNEIYTISSFKHLQNRNDANKEGSVYSMNIKGGFYLDKFRKQGGVSSDTELIGFITKNITKGLIKVNISESDVNCSAFTAVTPNNDVLFARNYDFDKTNVCITISNNPGKGRYKSFATVDLNYVGMDTEKDVSGLINKLTCIAAAYTPLDGINEMGLSCGIFMSYQGEDYSLNSSGTVATDQKNAEKDNFTSTTMLRMILDYCANVDEAVELISNYNLHDSAKSSFHYMIADATGKSAILEWLPADGGTDKTDNDGSARVLKVTYNTDEMYTGLRNADDFKYQWITNFIVSDHGSYYESNDDKPGWDRYEHIYNRLNATNGTLENEDAAMKILSEVGRRTWNGGGGVTVHSVVYNLTQKTVMWVANENYDNKSACYQYSFKTGKLTTLEK